MTEENLQSVHKRTLKNSNKIINNDVLKSGSNPKAIPLHHHQSI